MSVATPLLLIFLVKNGENWPDLFYLEKGKIITVKKRKSESEYFVYHSLLFLLAGSYYRVPSNFCSEFRVIFF